MCRVIADAAGQQRQAGTMQGQANCALRQGGLQHYNLAVWHMFAPAQPPERITTAASRSKRGEFFCTSTLTTLL
jgi:hypothetical protein